MFAKSFEMVLFGLTKISSSCRPRDGDRTALRFPLGFLTNHAGLDQSKAPHPNAATSSAASPGGSASDLRCVRYFFFWSKRCVRYFVCVLTAACAVGASRDHVTAITERLLACYAVPWDAFGGKKKSSFNNLYRSIFHRWGRTILQVSLHTMQLKNDFIYLFIYLFIYFANPGLSANGAKTMCSSSICYGYAHHPTKSLRLKVMCWFNFVTDYWLSMQTYLVASFGVRPKPSLLVIMSC